MNSARKRNRLLVPATLVALGLAATTAHAQSPITLSGFNADVVKTLGDTTAAAFDLANDYAFYSNSYYTGGGGLPASGAFTSGTTSGYNYQLNSFTANNVLMMTPGGAGGYSTGGTLTFSTPASYYTLGIISASSNAAATGDLTSGTVHYTNGTTSTFSFTAPDWYSTDGAISNIGRINPSSTTPDTTTGPGLNETLVTVTPGLSIGSITFTSTFGGADVATGIFAISGSSTPPPPPPLVTNGGFETGNFSGWTTTTTTGGTPSDLEVLGTAHSGNYGAAFGGFSTTTPDLLSQSIATTAGAHYILSFWAYTPNTSNYVFTAAFGGQTLLSTSSTGTQLPSTGYTQFTYNVTATSSSSLLAFTGANPPSYDYLDDVSLVAVAPEPSQYAAFGLGILGLGALALRARRRQAA
jgi:hypothetical protein